MKLIPMTDYVIEQIHKRESIGQCWINVTKYARFLKQPLKLEMFAPCDKEGEANRPRPIELGKGVFNYTRQNFWDEKNPDAFEKILFTGLDIEVYENNSLVKHKRHPLIKHNEHVIANYMTGFCEDEFKTIEDLVKFKLELKEGWENKAIAEI